MYTNNMSNISKPGTKNILSYLQRDTKTPLAEDAEADVVDTCENIYFLKEMIQENVYTTL